MRKSRACSTLGRLQSHTGETNFNIKPADKFKRKFKEKYGTDALEYFDMMVRNCSTLQEIANYFGFSREYARQVYNKLYHKSYSEHQRQRRYR